MTENNIISASIDANVVATNNKHFQKLHVYYQFTLEYPKLEMYPDVAIKSINNIAEAAISLGMDVDIWAEEAHTHKYHSKGYDCGFIVTQDYDTAMKFVNLVGSHFADTGIDCEITFGEVAIDDYHVDMYNRMVITTGSYRTPDSKLYEKTYSWRNVGSSIYLEEHATGNKYIIEEDKCYNVSTGEEGYPFSSSAQLQLMNEDIEAGKTYGEILSPKK